MGRPAKEEKKVRHVTYLEPHEATEVERTRRQQEASPIPSHWYRSLILAGLKALKRRSKK